MHSSVLRQKAQCALLLAVALLLQSLVAFHGHGDERDDGPAGPGSLDPHDCLICLVQSVGSDSADATLTSQYRVPAPWQNPELFAVGFAPREALEAVAPQQPRAPPGCPTRAQKLLFSA